MFCEDFIDPYEDYVYYKDLPDERYVKDWLEGISEALYETGNVRDLHNCFEELCSELKLFGGNDVRIGSDVKLKKGE